MKKKKYHKWYIWLAMSVIFLMIIQVLFTIPAPNKWLEAAWSAGDLLSFVGTVVLGYIAVKQTAEANKTAELTTNTSNKLIELQQKEYLPIISVTGFVGLTKHQYHNIADTYKPKICVGELRTEENEVELGYMLSLYTDDFNGELNSYCRSYEIHMRFSGKFAIKDIILEKVKFEGNEFEQEYTVGCSLESSLCNDDELKLFMFFISNQDFLSECSQVHKFLIARKLNLSIKLIGFDGKEYVEKISINKHLIKEKEARFKKDNVELPVSVHYNVN